MKVTIEKAAGGEIRRPQNPPPPSDLHGKPPRRKARGVRLKREAGAPNAKRSSRPETPLLGWKFDEGNEKNVAAAEEEEDKVAGEVGRKCRRRNTAAVSSRKLAAGIWRLRLAELRADVGQRVGFQAEGGHFGASIHCHHIDKVHHRRPPLPPPESPSSVSGPRHGLLYKFEPSFQFPNYAMEGATKWDPDGWKESDDLKQIFGQPKPNNHRSNAAKVISSLEAELEQARARINDLETDRRSSKKKLEQFLRKLSEERAAWRSREHEKIRAIIDDIKADLSREKKNRQRLEMVNSKLVNELADAKLSAKRCLQEYEKERKARELIEEVCDELAQEIGEDKAEVEALKRESMKFQEELDEERKMLQMAEVWREERIQMKLVDAKVMLEEKYSQMNKLISDLEPFVNSTSSTKSDSAEIKKVDYLLQAAASVDIQDVRELTYEPPNSDDIFSVLEDVNEGDSNPKMLANDGYKNPSGETSEWETVSHPGDQGSSFSPDESDPSTDNKSYRASDVEWEKDGARQLKKGSSISKLWRSGPINGDSYKIISVGRLSNGRLSNMSSDDHSSAMSPRDFPGQWSSPESGNMHVNRCIEWPRSGQKSSLKARLMEARMESQKVQLKQVLKQKI